MMIDKALLRQSLLPMPPSGEVVHEDGACTGALTPAAVLFPIILREGGHTVLLTRRTAHLRDHAGQVSFPGGRVELEDASPLETALRETEEEIGLDRRHVEVLGYLPEYRTGTGFSVIPVVATVTPPFELRPDSFEVAEVFEVPLSFLLDQNNHQRHAVHLRGALRHYFAMPYGDYFIWGATAGMIRSLSERLVVS
ncbi:MAG: CoA pyrophosphatase [Azonexus sp.]|jgi:8-oxo-dGTP pyrophosphatase MutT (NUDIX family)|nr:CoA pyrophosphatase [Azonexus sp.]